MADITKADMSWIDIAVLRNGAVVVDAAPGWLPFIQSEIHVEDIFEGDIDHPTAPGLYRWTDFTIGFWGEGEPCLVTGGTFVRATSTTMDREVVDFLHQLRRVNTERYQAWSSRPLMLCEHCGASEQVKTERCAPPFIRQAHAFTKLHPSLTVENDAGIMFDAIELGGEVGELLNVVKKLEREDRGWRGSRADGADFADECADVLICLDKLARRRGVDLIAAVIAKFNATSNKVGLPHKLSTPSAVAITQEEVR